MTTRTGPDACAYAEGRIGGTMPEAGYCLQFTRENYNIPALYASAIDAWNAAPDQHPEDRNPPDGVPVFFYSSSPYRHVCFKDRGTIWAITTWDEDIRALGSIEEVERTFGPYLGWTESLNGVRVWAPAPDYPKELDVGTNRIRHPDGTIALIDLGTGVFYRIPDTEANAIIGDTFGGPQVQLNERQWDVLKQTAADVRAQLGHD